MRPEDGMRGGFGIQEGNIEIVKSVIAVHRYPPNSKTGEQSDAFTAMRWDVRKLNSEWEAQGDDSLEQIQIRLGKPGEMRPGKLADPSNMDEEPEDLGADVDTEGNAIYSEPDKKVGGNWVAMAESLVKCGFKPDVIARGCATDYEGMKLHVYTKDTGRKYVDKRTGEQKNATELLCDRIHTHPYDKKGKGGSKAGAGAGAGRPAGVASATGKTVQAPSTTGTSNGPIAPVERLKALLAEPTARLQAVIGTGKPVKRATFQQAVSLELMARKVSIPEHRPIGEMLKSDEGLMEAGVECGFLVDVEGGTVQFG